MDRDSDGRLFIRRDDDDDNDSNISLTSTVSDSSQSEYGVDRILAEAKLSPEDGYGEVLEDEEPQMQYLVKWTGYPLYRSTWEPAENFLDPVTLQEWATRKLKEEQGLEPCYNLEVHEKKCKLFEERRARRKAKRNKLRELRRLGEEASHKSRIQASPPTNISGTIKTATLLGPSLFASSSRRPLLEAKPIDKGDGPPALSTTGSSLSPSRPNLAEQSTNSGADEFGDQARRDRASQAQVAHVDGMHSIVDKGHAQTKDALVTQKVVHDTKSLKKKGTAVLKKNNDDAAEMASSLHPTKQQASLKRKRSPSKVRSTSVSSKAIPIVRRQSLDSLFDSTPSEVEDNIPEPSREQTSTSSAGRCTDNAPRETSALTTNPESVTAKKTVSFKQALEVARSKAANVPNSSMRLIKSAVTKASTIPTSTKVEPVPKTQSKPSDTTLARVGKSIFSDWNEPKARNIRKQRLDTSTGFAPKDAQFGKLSQQNAIQKWASRELPPDPRALQYIDPRTGKLENPVDQDHTLVERASSSANDQPDRPTSSRAQRSSERPPQEPGSIVDHVQNSAEPRSSIKPSQAYISTTCRYWMKGHCGKGAYCSFAHTDTGHYPPKKPMMCQFWAKGWCRFSTVQCEFYHENINALNAPASYFERHYGRREDTPDVTGVRQDDVDRLRERKKASIDVSPPINTIDADSTDQNRSTVSQPCRPLRAAISPEATMACDDFIGPESLRDNSSTFNDQSLIVSRVADPGDTNHNLSTEALRASINLHVAPQGGNASIRMQVYLNFDPSPARRENSDRIKDGSTLEVQHFCLARDFKNFDFKADSSCYTGDIVHAEADAAFKSFANYMLINSTGAVIQHHDCLVIVHPMNYDDWDFIGPQVNTSSGLRFLVQPMTTPIYRISNLASEESLTPLQRICLQQFDLDQRRLFQRFDQKLEKNVFLMFPSRQTVEVQLITACLLEMGASVYNAGVHASWDQFRCDQKEFARSGVVLFHPTITQYHQIPAFNWVLFTTHYNLFQLGVDSTLRCHPEAATKYSCVRLFPQGAVTLITDDVFEYHPHLAVEVLRIFDQELNVKSTVRKNDCLLTRPDVVEWLVDLVDKYAAEDDPERHKNRLELLHIVLGLLPDKTIDPFISPEPPRLISPPSAEMPDYIGKWDYDEESATNWLVEWLAGWCISERESFRRFTVVHEQCRKPEQTPGFSAIKDPRGWSKKFSHIKVINVRLFKQLRGIGHKDTRAK
ncbi:hypothetical protein AAFC00_001280 [Neodothiora populina]|uniref:Chromo domain-containing protein n=1 Tax=Neodothiora populina TaxID=2781224 RepID=A0ABR3PNC9_9PEZI